MNKVETLEVLVRVRTYKFTNEQHLGFHIENKDIFINFGTEELGIQPLIESYAKAINDEDLALEQIRRSPDTVRIAEADEEFNQSFSGMHTYLMACRKHVDPAVRRSAENITVAFTKFGNIAKYPYRTELIMSRNLIQELRERTYDVSKIGLELWMNAHEQTAIKLRELLDARAVEIAGRTKLNVTETRRETDNSYQRVIARLEAMINIHGVDYVPGFVDAYNTHATEYKNALAQHLGRIHAEKSKSLDVKIDEND